MSEVYDYSKSWNEVYGLDRDPVRKFSIFPLLYNRIDAVKHDIIADLGCGNGSLIWNIKQISFEKAICIDSNATQIAFAKQNIEDSRVDIIESDLLDKIPISTGTVDIAVSVFVLNELSSIEEIFKQVSRILTPLGRFYCVMTHPFYPLYFDILEKENVAKNNKIIEFKDYFSIQKCYYKFTLSKDKSEYYHYNFSHIIDAVKGADLRISDMLEITTSDPKYENYPEYWNTRHIPKYLFFEVRR